MNKGVIIGLAIATLGFAALQATPSGRDPLGPGDEVIDEPDVQDPEAVDPPEERATPAPKKETAAKPNTKDVPAEDKQDVATSTPAPGDVPAVHSTGPLTSSGPPKIQVSSITPLKYNLPNPPVGQSTPMAQRVAVVGLLNKRNGLWRDLEMKPGEARRIGDVVVRLRACEMTAPWEHEKLTGAFVQLLVNDTDKKWRRYFSGWLYKETPSLNVVEHPVYDVWTKECRMRYSDTGPNTSVVRGGEAPTERNGDEEGG